MQRMHRATIFGTRRQWHHNSGIQCTLAERKTALSIGIIRQNEAARLSLSDYFLCVFGGSPAAENEGKMKQGPFFCCIFS